MENLNNTSIKTKHQGTKYFTLDSSLRNYLDKELKGSANLHFTTDSSCADLLIDQTDHKETYTLSFNMTPSEKSLVLNFKQLIYYMSKLSIIPREEIPQHESVDLSRLQKQRNFWKKDHFLIKDLNQLVRGSNNIYSYTQGLFQLPFFESFNTIHLFIHEKGLSNSTHSYINRQNIVHHNQNVSEFSSLFLAIKKSKNKSFGQSSLKASNFQIIGTCLALDFSLIKHNLILVLSKDDFLPQTQESVRLFKSYSESIKTYYEILLSNELNKTKTETIKQIINSMKEFTFKDKVSENVLNIEIALIIANELKQKNFSLSDSFHKERIELLGDLLNTLKHELSNPLFGMQLSSELLMLEKLEEDQLSFVQDINSSIKRSQQILNSFSNIYMHKAKFTDVNLVSLINEVLLLTKSESREIKKVIATKHDQGQLFINSNPTWLAQIIFNLVINSSQALKAHNIKAPLITIELVKKPTFIRLAFIDNGPGINKKDIKNIFTPFYTTKESGNGLGLAITQKLVHKLNGTISYKDPGIGSNFTIELPL